MKKRVLKAKEPVRVRFKKLANGNQSIYLDIYRHGQRSYEFLKIYIVPELTPLDKEANRQALVQAEAIKAQRILSITNQEAGIKNLNQGKILLCEWLEQYKQIAEKTDKRSWLPIVDAAIQVVESFDGNIRLKDINTDYCRRLVNFAQYDYQSKKGQSLAKKSAKSYIDSIKCALNEAVRRQIIVSNPFDMLSKNEYIKVEESKRTYLTTEEFNMLKETKCKSDMIKRAFLFSCTTGLRISDIKRLTWKDIETSNELTRLALRQKKTSTIVSLKLSQTQMQYVGERGKDDDLVFVLPSGTTVETYLKNWAKEAGITKHVTFHVARHTFATSLLTADVDLYTTSKLMGHSDIRTTQIYAKIIDKRKDDAIDKLANLLG